MQAHVQQMWLLLIQHSFPWDEAQWAPIQDGRPPRTNNGSLFQLQPGHCGTAVPARREPLWNEKSEAPSTAETLCWCVLKPEIVWRNIKRKKIWRSELWSTSGFCCCIVSPDMQGKLTVNNLIMTPPLPCFTAGSLLSYFTMLQSNLCYGFILRQKWSQRFSKMPNLF